MPRQGQAIKSSLPRGADQNERSSIYRAAHEFPSEDALARDEAEKEAEAEEEEEDADAEDFWGATEELAELDAAEELGAAEEFNDAEEDLEGEAGGQEPEAEEPAAPESAAQDAEDAGAEAAEEPAEEEGGEELGAEGEEAEVEIEVEPEEPEEEEEEDDVFQEETERFRAKAKGKGKFKAQMEEEWNEKGKGKGKGKGKKGKAKGAPKRGIVKKYMEERGFGFIVLDDQYSDELFFHRREVIGNEAWPWFEPGQRVECGVSWGKDGRPNAVNVRKLEDWEEWDEGGGDDDWWGGSKRKWGDDGTHGKGKGKGKGDRKGKGSAEGGNKRWKRDGEHHGQESKAAAAAEPAEPKSVEEWAAAQERMFGHMKPLPSGWIRIWSKSRNMVYFYSMRTGESRDDLDSLESAAPIAAPAPAPAERKLPPNWVRMTSKSSGRQYFYNTQNGQSQFEEPA